MAKRYTVISDLHLGDGSEVDHFHALGSEPHLRSLLQAVLAEPDHHLVLLGDMFELWQFDLEQICRHYEPLLALFQAFAGQGRLTWLIGNHDYELPYLRANRWFATGIFPFVQEFDIPEMGLHAVHGHMQDPHPERMIPLPGHEREFEVSREFVYYLKYLERIYPDASDRLSALGLTCQREWDDARAVVEAFRALDLRDALAAFLEMEQLLLHYVPPSQALTPGGQDPWELAAFKMVQQEGYRTVLMGHTHVPRWIQKQGATYINTGSWCRSSFPCSFVRIDLQSQSVDLWRVDRDGSGPARWIEKLAEDST